jgi:pyridoxal phosphate enzyme (YggS family)
MSDVADNLARVRERMEAAAKRAGRNPEEIRLVAVSKTVETGRVLLATQAGVKILGENYVQEAKEKIEKVGHPVEWHLIGHLQTNKAKIAVRLFDFIHSVDSLHLAKELNRAAEQQGKVLPVLIQISLSEEATKYGASETGAFLMAEEMSRMPALAVVGLMTMPPYFENPEDARPYFIKLRKWGERLRQEKFPRMVMNELSMGMSNDFEVAIEEGATFIRVGTAIFGRRRSR